MLKGKMAPALQHFSVIRHEQLGSTPEQRKPFTFGNTHLTPPSVYAPRLPRDFTEKLAEGAMLERSTNFHLASVFGSEIG